MKAFVTLIIILAVTTIAKAQLTGTKWTGTMMAPESSKAVLNFKADTLVIDFPDYNVTEVMTYTVKDTIITLKKVSGNSPCNVDDQFTIKYAIKADKLYVTPLTDPCDDRIHAWSADGYVKVNK